jgi:hypothetical protein
MKRITGSTAAAFALAIGFSALLPAQEKSPEAMNALTSMGKYLRTLKEFQVEAAITTEDVLTDGQKVEYSTSINTLAELPNKLRVDVEGDQQSRLFLYDGKSFTLFARLAGVYATVPAPDSIVALIDVVGAKYDIDIPLLDLFLWGSPRGGTDEITAAADLGPGVVEGVTCEHYIYRQPGIDWQAWIQLGNNPLPRKLVLTTTTDEARPQHTSVLTWNLAPSYNSAAFAFHPPAGAQRISFAEEKQSSAGSK